EFRAVCEAQQPFLQRGVSAIAHCRSESLHIPQLDSELRRGDKFQAKPDIARTACLQQGEENVSERPARISQVSFPQELPEQISVARPNHNAESFRDSLGMLAEVPQKPGNWILGTHFGQCSYCGTSNCAIHLQDPLNCSERLVSNRPMRQRETDGVLFSLFQGPRS